MTIAISPRSWSAWDTQSTFFAALQEAGIPLGDAESWFRSRRMHCYPSEERRLSE